MTLDAETKSMYILGGFAGDIQSRVTRIQLPHDLCNLWSGNRDKCRSVFFLIKCGLNKFQMFLMKILEKCIVFHHIKLKTIYNINFI